MFNVHEMSTVCAQKEMGAMGNKNKRFKAEKEN
jgi:hypothetical protein